MDFNNYIAICSSKQHLLFQIEGQKYPYRKKLFKFQDKSVILKMLIILLASDGR